MPVKKQEIEEFKFKKGDDVLGTIAGEPARGKVVAVNGETITIRRRGQANTFQSKFRVKGDLEERKVTAEDFKLLYRKEK